MRVGIQSFYVGSKKLKFKEPLLLDMLEGEAIQGGMCVTHKELGLSACGPSWVVCHEIILEELEALWNGYVLVPDDELTASDIAFKSKLQGMVKGKGTKTTKVKEHKCHASFRGCDGQGTCDTACQWYTEGVPCVMWTPEEYWGEDICKFCIHKDEKCSMCKARSVDDGHVMACFGFRGVKKPK